MASIVEKVKSHFMAWPNAQLMTIDGIRVSMDYGWGMIRASNTQPVLCLRFESDSKEGLEHIKKDFATALLPHMSPESLEQCMSE